MNIKTAGLLGKGIYSVPEATRLTGVSGATIRRWTRGYRRIRRGQARLHPALWKSDFEPINGAISISFLDLMEVRFVGHFTESGVPWRIVYKAAQEAMDMYKNPEAHPFATTRFRSEGKRIFAEVIRNDGNIALIDLVSNQTAFHKIVSPSLYDNLDFSREGIALRWWPIGRENLIVIDPMRSFGQPIVAREGVPTYVLADAYRAEHSDERVAKWHGVDVSSVRQAVEYESKRAA